MLTAWTRCRRWPTPGCATPHWQPVPPCDPCAAVVQPLSRCQTAAEAVAWLDWQRMEAWYIGFSQTFFSDSAVSVCRLFYPSITFKMGESDDSDDMVPSALAGHSPDSPGSEGYYDAPSAANHPPAAGSGNGASGVAASGAASALEPVLAVTRSGSPSPPPKPPVWVPTITAAAANDVDANACLAQDRASFMKCYGGRSPPQPPTQIQSMPFFLPLPLPLPKRYLRACSAGLETPTGRGLAPAVCGTLVTQAWA